jgi:hypothetical protein
MPVDEMSVDELSPQLENLCVSDDKKVVFFSPERRFHHHSGVEEDDDPLKAAGFLDEFGDEIKLT